MAFDLKKLKDAKKNRKDLLNKLQESFVDKGNGGDRKFWKLATNDSKEGLAIIRFVPNQDDEMYATTMNHTFRNKGTKKSFNERCPRTLGWDYKCPICVDISAAYNENSLDDARTITRDIKKYVRYIANIMVVDDTTNPDNNGKVFKFTFGKSILDKIKGELSSDCDGEDPVNVFDIFDGKNFKLKSKANGEFINYDDASFLNKNCFDGKSDEEIISIINSTHSFAEYKEVKSFEEIDKLYRDVIGTNNQTTHNPTPTKPKPVEQLTDSSEFDLDNLDDLLDDIDD